MHSLVEISFVKKQNKTPNKQTNKQRRIQTTIDNQTRRSVGVASSSEATFPRECGGRVGDLLLCAVDELVLVGPLVTRPHAFVLPQRLGVVVKLLCSNGTNVRATTAH